MKTVLFFFVPIFFALSCSGNEKNVKTDPAKETEDPNALGKLPADNGGTHSAKLQNDTQADFGYYLYTPGNYDTTEGLYPALIFLHGAGEIGNSNMDSSELDKVLMHGPPKLVETGKWNPSYPMLVVSPQTSEYGWNTEKLHSFISYLLRKYRINPKRIYLTGLSMGGFGAFDYVGNKGSDAYTAAIVPICGGGDIAKAENFRNVPVWAFHGDNDSVVSISNSIGMIDAINGESPLTEAKLTVYPGIGHESWTMTYNGEGMETESDEYDAFEMSIYDWLFSLEKE